MFDRETDIKTVELILGEAFEVLDVWMTSVPYPCKRVRLKCKKCGDVIERQFESIVKRRAVRCDTCKQNLYDQINALLVQGVQREQVAEQLGISVYMIGYYQKNNRVLTKQTEKYIVGILKKSGITYISGYTGFESKIKYVVDACGHENMLSYHEIVRRKYKNCCRTCNAEHYKTLRNEKKIRDAQEKQRQKVEAAIERAAKRAGKQAAKLAEKQAESVQLDINKRLAIHVCRNCGVEYCIGITGYNSVMYCSEKCQDRYHDRLKDHHRRYRMRSGDYDADISLDRLYKRDNGICWLCGKKCDKTDFVSTDTVFIAGNRYPSVDHVIPLAKGGLHKWENVRLACRQCNSSKGDTLKEVNDDDYSKNGSCINGKTWCV